MATGTREQHVIVVGDFMIDTAWVLSAVARDTVQAHSQVPPMLRINPLWRDKCVGGAGMSLMALRTVFRSVPNTHLHGVGIWDPEDDGLLASLTQPDETQFPGPRVTLHRLRTRNPVRTTIKARFYAQVATDQPNLVARYDQDPSEPPEFSGDNPLSALEPPLALRPEEIRAIVIADFKKGTVRKSLLYSLSKCVGKNCVWLIDSKRPEIFEELPTGITIDVLTLNRDEAAHLAAQLTGRRVSRPPAGRSLTIELLTLLDDLAGALRTRQPRVKRLVVKLDRDGACLCQLSPATADKSDLVLVRPPKALDTPGIAAGDFFNAALLYSILDSSHVQTTADIVRYACSVSVAWLEFCRRYWDPKVAVQFKSDIVRPEFLSSEPGTLCSREWPEQKFDANTLTLATELKTFTGFFQYSAIIARGQIELARAKGVLGDFISTDIKLRTDIRAFVAAIESYVRATGRTRPLNCVVVAQPGSGKSFFAKQVAAQTGCELIEVNCGQMVSPGDLIENIARMQNVKDRPPLLFLDEVDSQSGHYASLLAPLWDSAVTIRGEIRRWRDRAVSILVASQVTTVEEFIEKLSLKKGDRGDDKGRDLLSRLNGPRLTLAEHGTSPETLTSRVYLAAQMIATYHPSARVVERGLLDLVYNAPTFNPRTVEHFVASLPNPVDGVITVRSAVDRVQEFARNLGYIVDVQKATATGTRHFAHIGYGRSRSISLNGLEPSRLRIVTAAEQR